MSADPSSLPRSNSPASSDSSSRPRLRLGGKDEPLKRDKNYRRYASSVERALSLFDTALQEWADYISFLSRLLKALKSHPTDLPVVPYKATVSKRLAQCLNPSLPSGVHQKALEVYAYIFSLIKIEGLSHDLPLYLPGLAPTLTFASLTVRPLFLSLLDTHICVLEPWAIRPALKAIILAILPGLEEETSDDFEHTLQIVNKLRNVISQIDTQKGNPETGTNGQYFWQCLFLASITSPSRRIGTLAYLNRYLPRLGWPDRRLDRSEPIYENDLTADLLVAANAVILPEPGLLIRCFASGLSDDQPLVQRNFLDLLVTHVPLNSPVLQLRTTADDLQKLVIAAIGVVARRDMSLNRRLWTWLLGPENANDHSSVNVRKSSDSTDRPESSPEILHSTYFTQFGLKPLVSGILKMIEQDSRIPSERAKPLRISLPLMDRWDAGRHIAPAVFLPAMRSVQSFKINSSKAEFDEVFRSASAFFDGIESSMIFSKLHDLINWSDHEVESRYSMILTDLKLIHFIIENFNVREEDMVLIHIPLLILSFLVKEGELSTCEVALEKRRILSDNLMRVMSLLINLLPDRALARKTDSEKPPKQSLNSSRAYISEALHIYYSRSESSIGLPPLPFTPRQLGELIIQEAHALATSALEGNDDVLSTQESITVLIALLRKLPKSRILRGGQLYSAMYNCIDKSATKMTTAAFSIVSSITSAVAGLYFMHTPGFYLSYDDVCNIVPALVRRLWQFLSPVSPKFHVEAVRGLWLLHSICWQDHLIEASITSLMISVSPTSFYNLTSKDQTERYFTLWSHSNDNAHEPLAKQANGFGQPHLSYHSSMLARPLFVVLDILSHGSNEAYREVQQWLHELSSIHKVLCIVQSRLDALFLHPDSAEVDEGATAISIDNHKECSYLLQTMSNILSSLSHNGWSILLTHTCSPQRGHLDLPAGEDSSESNTLHSLVVDTCLRIINGQLPAASESDSAEVKLQLDSLFLVRQLLLSPGADELAGSGIDVLLVERLSFVLGEGGSPALQCAIIDALLAALKVRFAPVYSLDPPPRPKNQSRERLTSPSLISFTSEKGDKYSIVQDLPDPPEKLFTCLLNGISSPHSKAVVEKWITLLCESLPLFSGTIFQILLTLVECLCKTIKHSYLNLQLVFKKTEGWPENRAEHATTALLTGLETCIATAHERLLIEEANVPTAKSPDQAHGFFGNMMSGVFALDVNQNRPSAANNRITVLLCFQDVVRLCFSIWSWDTVDQSDLPEDSESLASFQYTSRRMRNRSRRILEHLFRAETLECLETLVEMWARSDADTSSRIFSLLHTLDGSRPKAVIPAIFNAIYTRTNPSALEPARKSAMTLSIGESELVAFLVIYARSLDDDVLDEIWIDCITFLRDVLSNPFPHRQILPRLVEFAVILGAKMENTGFGEDRRMRKDLGDMLVKLLAAIFSSKPLGLSQDPGFLGRPSADHDSLSAPLAGPDDMLSILASSIPAFSTALGDSDRTSTALAGISTNIIGPILRSRLFPNNLNRNLITVLQHIAKIPAGVKSWKRDIAEAFNDSRFFGSSIELVKGGWMGLLRQWVLVDRDRLSELMSRLSTPSAAGIMFGVGASAARLDADRKTQLNLRRIALIILSADGDYFIGELPLLFQKLEDLLGATSSSSPSFVTRPEVFMVFRALVLRTTGTTLSPFWPLINAELYEAISAVLNRQQPEIYNPYSLLQACKLLDTLLVLGLDDFQLLEWLYVTDTTDAVYPPERWEPTALADELSQKFGLRSATSADGPDVNDSGHGMKQPWLVSDGIRETAKDELVDQVLRPFFDRLSIYAFESTYSMGSPNVEACRDDLLADLFNENTMAS